eukprot:11572644-Alexandrium_andersonii.AAC.1
MARMGPMSRRVLLKALRAVGAAVTFGTWRAPEVTGAAVGPWLAVRARSLEWRLRAFRLGNARPCGMAHIVARQ